MGGHSHVELANHCHCSKDRSAFCGKREGDCSIPFAHTLRLTEQPPLAVTCAATLGYLLSIKASTQPAHTVLLVLLLSDMRTTWSTPPLCIFFRAASSVLERQASCAAR